MSIIHNTEEFVENWLNSNKTWFSRYAKENLDLNTIQEWLKEKGKTICNCKKSAFIENKNTNSFLRRKSVATLPFTNHSTTNSINKQEFKDSEMVINHHLLSLNKKSSIIEKKLNKSSSFSSLKLQDSDEDIKPKIKFYLNNNQDKDNQDCDDSKNLTIMLNNCKVNEGNKSQLLKTLIKSKIKLPNKGVRLSYETKLNIKSKLTNKYEFLCFIIQDTSKEICLNETNETIKINLKLLTDSQHISLFFYDRNSKRLSSFKHDDLFLNPCELKSLEYEHILNIDGSIFEHTINSGNVLEVSSNEFKTKPYELNIDFINQHKLESLTFLPIKNVDQEVIACVLIASTKLNPEYDFEILKQYLEFCANVIIKSQTYELCANDYERNRSLIEVIHDLFQQQTDLDKIFYQIINKAQILLKCQKCTILLLIENDEQENSKKTFDVYEICDGLDKIKHLIVDNDNTKISKDLINHVISTGQKLNIKDAYSDPRFNSAVDDHLNFTIKTKLLMPIRNLEGDTIGCARVLNRLDNQPFDENDEQLLEAFCIFCGLVINNTIIYSELERSMAEKTVAFEVLSYHANCSKIELNSFMEKIPKDEDFSLINKLIKKEYLSSYIFDDFCLNNDEMVMTSYEMFKELNFIKTFKIDKKTLYQWLLTVRKNYRDVEYHNWNHAFNVCQTMFSIFINSSITWYLKDIEKLVLLVGCLCHDLDHRGTNNLFQIESHSPLAQLYGTQAPMEKHHFNHCVMILNSPGSNIFSNLKSKTYQMIISLIKEAILATDLADHFAVRNNFKNLADNKNFNFNSEEHRILLRKNLMTCCDLASAAKPWPIHKKIVNLVTKEFFAQGEKERNELNIEPTEMMDSRRSDQLPRLQIGWLDKVCLPLYRNFSLLCNSFNEHIVRINHNRLNWSHLDFSIKENYKIKNKNSTKQEKFN